MWSLDCQDCPGKRTRDIAEIKLPHEGLKARSKSNKAQIENTPSLALFLVNKIIPARYEGDRMMAVQLSVHYVSLLTRKRETLEKRPLKYTMMCTMHSH